MTDIRRTVRRRLWTVLCPAAFALATALSVAAHLGGH